MALRNGSFYRIRKSILAIVTLMLYGVAAHPAQARTGLENGGRGEASMVSPYYFGPNAFPIPDMLVKTRDKLRIELATDYYHGRRGDNTNDITLRVNIPLFTSRANLTAWWVMKEWWSNTYANMTASGILPENIPGARKGSTSGDIYVSADVQILTEGKLRPGLTGRAALKTASGGKFYYARYYDSAGYFFDATVSKRFRLLPEGWLDISGALTAGFLCWQTGNGRQNDAVMFGAQIGLHTKSWKLTETFSGYSGWEGHSCIDGHLAHDCPMSFKTDLVWYIRDFEVLGGFQYGLADYPYYQLRLGAAYNIDILHKKDMSASDK